MNIRDDQPIENRQHDKLALDRYVNALNKSVFIRTEESPFTVGIYGNWGTGKTSLLNLIEESLISKPNEWIVVKFSPWMYRNDPSLLLPLLLAIAEKNDEMKKLLKTLAGFGIKTFNLVNPFNKVPSLSELSHFHASSIALPLISALISMYEDNEKQKSLNNKIGEVIAKMVSYGAKRIVFLIDDLDRCHDDNQIITLLEQIKLLFHHKWCTFIIFADRDRIIKAIDSKFNGQGKEYLEKFVQLPIDLHPHNSKMVVETLNCADDSDYMKRVAAVLDNNPRRVKNLWNRAQVGLSIINEIRAQRGESIIDPSLELMVKWLLLMEVAGIKKNPYGYLELEASWQKTKGDIDPILIKYGFKKGNNEWENVFCNKLAAFLRSGKHRFERPEILSLYSEASGEGIRRTREHIEEAYLSGTSIKNEDYSHVKLEHSTFNGLKFVGCAFREALFDKADLNGIIFEDCTFDFAVFDGAKNIQGAKWIGGRGIDSMDTEPFIYEKIADHIVAAWRSESHAFTNSFEKDQLFKMYKTILDRHRTDNTLDARIQARLIERGDNIKKLINPN